MSITEEYIACYDWPEEIPKDLGLKAGETITVQVKYEHGWWYGYSQNKPEKQGYFPKNYVRKKTPDEKSVTASISDEGSSSSSEKLDEQIVDAVLKPFSINSLTAFDELVDSGMTVEVIAPSKEATPPPVYEGGRVEVQVCGITWDGSTTETKCFSRGMLSFTAGANQVTIGLDSGIRRLRVGDKASIVCAPCQAYGEPGNPPTVLPNSYIVYFVYVLSCSDTDKSNPSAVGPAELCGPGITTKFEDVINEGKGVKSSGQVLTDEMLSQAAAAMGLSSPPLPPPPPAARR